MSRQAGANEALHLTGPALRVSETWSLQPARQVNAVVRRQDPRLRTFANVETWRQRDYFGFQAADRRPRR
jgi:hypothetical protein